MTFGQALFLAFLQGATELFPVSSLGHTVLVPALLHWKIDRSDPSFLAFVVALHFGTALALIVFYRRDWARITRAFLAAVVRGRLGEDPDEKLAWLLLAGTIPVAIVGVLFERPVRQLFGSPLLVAVFLMVNAAIMFAGENLRRAERGSPARPLATLPWSGAVKIGLSQALALLPGISRSGASIVGGLVLGLSHDDAARFSFLLATPAIFAASVLELPQLAAPGASAVLFQALAGALLAGLTAYASVAFLTRYFHTNDLRPFGWYCLIFGAFCFVLAFAKVIA
ncbi:MAG TPA: undecaprenyl-diphosphate phosphatase [Candidatus Baltobacteraceae bacterium]|nr:undecaprenyl-diphosphate phosphatase [Candidatus Baltobacteraceae bacterium]